MKKIFVGIGIIICALIFCVSQKTKAQGACYDTGGEITWNGQVWFVCPMGGGTSPCAYACRAKQ